MGFNDQNSNWEHIGIGNDITGSTCSNPPVIWMEWIMKSGASGRFALACTSYGTESRLTIAYDTYISQFAWFINGAEKASVSFSGEGSYIGSNGHLDMIEYTGTSAPPCPGMYDGGTTYRNALQYGGTAYNGVLPSTYNNPSHVYSYDSNPAFGSCWGRTLYVPAPYAISFQHS
jgi:hypothetical protein